MNVGHAPTVPATTGEPHDYARLHARWRPLARGVWITLAACTLGVSLASLPAYLAQLRTPCAGAACGFQQLTPQQVAVLAGLGVSLGAYAAYLVAIALINVVVCLAVSAVIALRRPDDRMAVIVALMLVTLGPLAVGQSVAASPSPWRVPNQYLSNLCIGLLLLVFSLFPTGRFVPRWLRWPMLALILGSAVDWLSLLTAVGVQSSFAPAGFSELKIRAVALGFVVFLVEAALLVVVQLYRYRRVSSPLQRQQTKWVVVGFAVPMASWVVEFVPYLLFPLLAAPGSLYLPALIALQGVQLLFIPLAFGVAMLRYRLWDIETLVNRTLVYGTLTVVLAGIYAGLVIGLQALLGGLLGGIIRQDSTLAIVLSTLAIVVLSQPLRRGIQRSIDRRFYRRKYDAVQVLAAFGTTLRHEMDLDALREQLLAVAQETMQPEHASLWLRAPERAVRRRHGPP
jgi:hypothetical protein